MNPMNDPMHIFGLLLVSTGQRFPSDIVTPLPGKTWKECFVHDEGMYMLHYHVVGDKSSKVATYKDGEIWSV